MTSELTLLVLRLAFLAVMWVFVFSVVYALRSDLFGSRATAYQQVIAQSRSKTAGQQQAASTPSQGVPQVSKPVLPTTIAITSGPQEGRVLPLGESSVSLGRGGDNDLVIQDDYTSTHHAKLLLWNDAWMIQDLDSTNGTFVDGKRITQPVAVRPNMSVRIGTTTFELR